ncbi:MAG TPA: sugar ABC transporter substrate-binding protein [Solirubrobacterales bacterium]|nr:sugar ABC transporter substrate-binding protein [Solirubrobacterales bacterium]
MLKSISARSGRGAAPLAIALIALSGVLLAACGGGSSSGSSSGTEASASTEAGASEAPLKVVYFASATANGFSNAVWTSMEKKAEELGNVELSIQNGNFDATTQYNQVQDATTSQQYDGAVLLANDTVGIVPAVEGLIGSGVVVSNVLNPLGPELDSLTPQVEGLLSVIEKPSYATTLQAEEAAKWCEAKDPCRVVLMVGGLQYPFDKIRYEAYKSVLDEHPNIEILATGQGNYDRNTALTVMTNILQAHPEIDALISGDQMTQGAQIALKNAGYDVKKMVGAGELFIDSEGASKQGVAAVRAGEWNLTAGNWPATAGELALEQVVKTLRGEEVEGNINLAKAAPVPTILTKPVLEQNPTFEGEWSG